MTTLNKKTCRTCRFFKAVTASQVSTCQKKSPSVSPDDATAWWPLVMDTDWCGDHESASPVERPDATITAIIQQVADLASEIDAAQRRGQADFSYDAKSEIMGQLTFLESALRKFK
jgi:hypothetical protein